MTLTSTMFYLIFVIAVVLGLMLLIAWFSPRSPGFRRVTGGIYLLLTLGLVVYPLFTTVWFLTTDAGLRGARSSTFAFSLHRSLSAKLPDYIDRRIESKIATTLNRSQITATESPVYGAFFYLQATERLQQQWLRDPSLCKQAPAVTGVRAINASLRLMLDPSHAHWVRDYWGDDYLTEPNCFYRMLLIGCLTSHHNLTGETAHLPLLRTVVADLVSDLDSSPVGLIDDYPGQCFPCDVACCIAMIERAARALGEDRSEWARQAFLRLMLLYPDGLPPYTADAATGAALSPSRGCTNGFFFTYSPFLAPELSRQWYQPFVREFWQENALAAGWREFSNEGNAPAFGFDPDSGPVLAGFGTAATGLGLGCTRAHGDHRRAGMLGAEMIAAAVPLPGDTLLVPRLVSDLDHAPYFAEISILHQLSLLPAEPVTAAPARVPLPPCAWYILGIEATVLALMLFICQRLLRHPRPVRHA